MRLDAHVTVASRGLDASLTVLPGRTLALLGPNGSGKSSLLSALAGLLRPTSGFAHLGDVTLDDLPANERPIGLLGQEPLLFPHLTALDNVAFPARARGESSAKARAEALSWLDLVDAATFASSRPHQLSGGQAQRVAIARALAAQPSVLLLDEPLAALDVDSAVTVRAVLATVLAGRTSILATHSVIDAAMLADDIAVLYDGHIVETGPVQDVLARPQHAFTARMAGRGQLRGRRTSTGIKLADGSLLSAAQGDDAEVGTDALLSCPPRGVKIGGGAGAPENSMPANTVRVSVDAVEPRQETLRVWAGGLIADIDIVGLDIANIDGAGIEGTHAPTRFAPRPGDQICLTVDPASAVVYAARVRGK